MKNTITRIIAGLLAIAIVLTGVSFDATTAHAGIATSQKDREGLEDFKDLKDTTVTMKIGDTKSIDYFGQATDLTDEFAWSSSNENVVSMTRIYEIFLEDMVRLHSFDIKAEKAGTAVIKGVNPNTNETISFTVVVEKQKITKKMKKCKKHAWRITKSATCIESGMRFCKKCKLKQTIARKSHDFETVTEERYDYEYILVYQCGACMCEDPSVHDYDDARCENWCDAEFDMRDYGSNEAALKACRQHKAECKGRTFPSIAYREVPVGKKLTYKDINVCESCGYSEKGLELMFNVNDPNERILVKDL